MAYNEMADILAQVRQERVFQKEKWGDEHDEMHEIEEWLGFIEQRLIKLHDQQGEITPYRRRHLFVTIAALAIAAVEALEARDE